MTGKEFPQSTLDAGAAKPKTAPEAKPDSSAEKSAKTVPALGQTMAQEFTTDPEKDLLGKGFEKIFGEKFTEFTKDFQTKFCDATGKPDVLKILSLFGLEKILGPLFAPGEPASTSPNLPTSTETTSDTAKATPPADAKKETAKVPSPTKTKRSSTRATTPTETTATESRDKIPGNPGTMTGAKFLEKLKQLGDMNKSRENQRKMEMMILEEVAKGNIPSFCRPENGKTIEMKGADGTVVKFKAGLDYLAIGTNSNFIRVPITPVLAQTLSEKYGWGLPTGAMTDAIHSAADIKLRGIGLVNTPSDQAQMQGNDFVATHNAKIDQMLGPDGLARLQSGKYLVAGHKKDVIISSVVVGNPNGPLDYRGLYTDGVHPIQRNPAHDWFYRDYSHGFRPIHGNVIIAYPDGHTESKPYYEALNDPRVAKILNGAQGAFDAEMAYHDPKKGRPDNNSSASTNIG